MQSFKKVILLVIIILIISLAVNFDTGQKFNNNSFLLERIFAAGNEIYSSINRTASEVISDSGIDSIITNVEQRLPAGTKSEEITIHEVQPGENLHTIADKYEISVDTLAGANDIKNVNNIQIGDKLVILPTDGIEYTLSPGDDFQQIVDRFQVAAEKIKQINNITSAEDLQPGDYIILPDVLPSIRHDDDFDGTLTRPVEGRVSSPFGPRWGDHHDGIDYAVPTGTPVEAAAEGTITHTGYTSGYGHTVIIKHQEGFETLYAHLNSYHVSEGEYVREGQVIAASGNSGRSTGPHLHFEVRVNGTPVDPENYLTN